MKAFGREIGRFTERLDLSESEFGFAMSGFDVGLKLLLGSGEIEFRLLPVSIRPASPCYE